MSKAASRGNVDLVATTMAPDDSPGPLTRSACKNAAAAGSSKPLSSSRFGTEASAAAASKKDPETTTSTRAAAGAAAGNKSEASPPSSLKYSVLLPTYCEAQNIGIIVSMLVKVFEEK